MRNILSRSMQALAVVAAVAGPARAQQAPGQGGGPAALLSGAWHGQQAGPNGVTDAFMILRPDGQFQAVFYNGASNPSVMQHWGRYAVRQRGPNTMELTMEPEGVLPQQICMPGAGCRVVQVLPPSREPLVVLDQNTIRMQSGVMQRSSVPPQLMQPQPTTLVTPPPPPPPAAPPAIGYRGYQTPVDPSARNHGDIQQERICAINDGHLVQLRGGGLRCVQ